MQSSYCPSPYRYTRRVTREVMVGNVGVGGSNPIRIQSMLTSDTRDTDACVKEALELAEAGCEIIRLTAQTKAYAANLENIARELRAAGCHVPLVADIHFKPDAAMEAAKWVEKIRINPGNFVDKKKFEVREYSDAEYREELDRLREEFTPLVLFCREHGRAMRIGSNHGSLSDRILNRFGDTPEGMVESAIEFAQIARDLDYHSLVFSMKASNVKVMVAAYRLLVERMNALGPDWNYPIHLGVTEAGGGEDGRIKSAVGIGSFRGSVDIAVNARVDFRGTGNKSVGIGSLEKGVGSIDIRDASVSMAINARFCSAIGTIDGSINTVVDGANIALNCEGSEIAGIGDPKGAGSILLKDAELDMTMLAASVIDVGTRCGSVSTQGGRKSVRINP